MRINTNVSALNAQRQLGVTNRALSQSVTRLSSGFRINRAADDAAGLGIANKLRGDIRSMTQAARNGEQANSLAQIAEGAVSGIATMLDRMKELATQANSDTVDEGGRERLQAEFDALRSEIGRTAATTQFGSTKLINGGFGSKVDAATTATGVTGVHAVKTSGAAAGTYALTSGTAGSLTMTMGGVSQTISNVADGQTLNFSTFGITIDTSEGYVADSLAGTNVVIAAGSGSFQVGSSGSYGVNDLLSFTAIDMQTNAGALNLDGLDLTSAANAQTALSRIDDAVKSVNSALGSIGAFQNRIENAMANLNTAIENLSASESVIRDLDMAAEMTKFSKNQILAQAGTAMLAQANASSQNVLQLLRG